MKSQDVPPQSKSGQSSPEMKQQQDEQIDSGTGNKAGNLDQKLVLDGL